MGADLGVLPSLRNLMRDSSDPNLISFAGLSPAFECFPINDFRRVTDQIINITQQRLLGLAPTERSALLRAEIARRLRVKTEQVLIVSGQQGLHLVARCLLDPGDAVIIDRPGLCRRNSEFSRGRREADRLGRDTF